MDGATHSDIDMHSVPGLKVQEAPVAKLSNNLPIWCLEIMLSNKIVYI